MDEIRKGTWANQLPGTRALCAWFQVSGPTMARALRGLVAKKVLEERGARRRYGILAKAATKPAQAARSAKLKTQRHLLIVTHHPMNVTANSTRDVMDRIYDKISPAGWAVEHEVMDFFNAKKPRRSWDEVLRTLKPDAILGVFGRPVLAEWALQRRQKILFLGGVPADTGVPIYAVRMADTVREAVRRLVAAGHTKFFMPLCERAQPFSDSLIQAMSEELAAAGIPFLPRIHAPQLGYSGPDVIWSLAEDAIAKYRPTAWIILDWREMVTVSSLFNKRGIRMPQDVSVVLLNDEATAAWHRPLLCRFSLPVDLIARQVVRWLEGRVDPTESKRFDALWQDGESIAGPPQA